MLREFKLKVACHSLSRRGHESHDAGYARWGQRDLRRNNGVGHVGADEESKSDAEVARGGEETVGEKEGDGEGHQRNELLETGHQGDSEAAPPVPLLLPESAGRRARFLVTRYQKTRVFVNVWALGRDPRYWDSPTEFEPEIRAAEFHGRLQGNQL
ncbi:unnamed protein product [Musa acuminata subsp. burmannicoides]